jgi:hypothetical protein
MTLAERQALVPGDIIAIPNNGSGDVYVVISNDLTLGRIEVAIKEEEWGQGIRYQDMTPATYVTGF